MRSLFLRYAPAILGLVGLLYSISDLLIDKLSPGHVHGIVWFIGGVIYISVCAALGIVMKRYCESLNSDFLTGLKNRSYFYPRLYEELAAVTKSKTPASLLLIDVDRFKLVNDTYGHVAGDNVLKQLANIFKQSAGTRYIAARWGGEEFTMLLPQTDIAAAVRLAEEIRQQVEKCDFSYGNAHIKITVSIGAVTTNRGIVADDFIKYADQMLYKAKEKRNATADMSIG